MFARGIIMRIQPLEVYTVEDTGELVLKHMTDLKDALISSEAIMITNHNDKTIVLWIGKNATTRAKFAAARASRRFLTERSLSYRVKTCDEEEEPDWFQDLFNIKVATRMRDEPPALEVLAILNEMKSEGIPNGYQREACIISRDFYVPVEHKASIMGKDTSTIKFEKSSYMPEGFFILPSEAYRPRLLVRNGKILATDLLISLDVTKKEAIIDSLEQKMKKQKHHIENLQQEGEKKNQQIETLQRDISKKNQHIDTLGQDNAEKTKQIEILEQDTTEKTKRIEKLEQDIAE